MIPDTITAAQLMRQPELTTDETDVATVLAMIRTTEAMIAALRTITAILMGGGLDQQFGFAGVESTLVMGQTIGAFIQGTIWVADVVVLDVVVGVLLLVLVLVVLTILMRTIGEPVGGGWRTLLLGVRLAAQGATLGTQGLLRLPEVVMIPTVGARLRLLGPGDMTMLAEVLAEFGAVPLELQGTTISGQTLQTVTQTRVGSEKALGLTDGATMRGGLGRLLLRGVLGPTTLLGLR